MRILITGAAGMLGSAMTPMLAESGHEVWATDIRAHRFIESVVSGPQPSYGYLDVRSASEVSQAFRDFDPELVLHLGAYINLEDCEKNPRLAEDTNVMGTRIMAEHCKSHGIAMLYVSTAGVFDGTKDPSDPYREDDEPNPLNVYGATKLGGEHQVREVLDEHFIVRAGWMMGGGPLDHKFIGMIMEQLDAGATELYAVDDKFGSPTYVRDFSRCVDALIRTRNYGLFHMSGRGRASRHDVACHLLQVLGRAEVPVHRVGSEYFERRFTTPRARSEVLENANLTKHGLNLMRPWQEALTDYLTSTAFQRAPATD